MNSEGRFYVADKDFMMVTFYSPFLEISKVKNSIIKLKYQKSGFIKGGKNAGKVNGFFPVWE